MSFPFYKQLYSNDCGPTCLRIISAYYKKKISSTKLRNLAEINKDGVNLLGIAKAAEHIGFNTRSVKLTYLQLTNEALLPCIVHFNQNHFVVVVKSIKDKFIIIADPAVGIVKYKKNEFLKSWIGSIDENLSDTGIVLLLKPSLDFFKNGFDEPNLNGLNIFLNYLSGYKKYYFQVLISLIIVSFIQLLFPFLTQSIVDVGINTRNLDYIYIVLIALFFLHFSKTIVEFFRSKILMYISNQINFSILSDFWIKLMKLPIAYFDTKQIGDTLQRIGDHKRIEQFLTYNSISTIFSVFNFILFSFVLLFYSSSIFTVFFIGSFFYLLWIKLFLSVRKTIDIKRFGLASKENTMTMQLIYGMQEIKINNCEDLMRSKWENIQTDILDLNFRSLSVSQYQQSGALFINEGKNIFITFLVAKSVINGYISLGAMVAIQYIIANLNSPIEQFIQFIQLGQDAKLSSERLNEIHQLENEETYKKNIYPDDLHNCSIKIFNLSFKYPGVGNELVLSDINLVIPENKITAIVGVSGSGKTTLLKLLMQFYDDYNGDIYISEENLKNIIPKKWRSLYSCVMQDGYIFSDTIQNNIALGEEYPNYEKLNYACDIANIYSFIESLPLGYDTKIGAEGIGISQGQKQRILIARAIYKSPKYLFFDEATNALDANNEYLIVNKLEDFFKMKTVVIVAHRLSTVKNADKIIVLDQGRIVEEGSHIQLVKRKGYYYNLVKNQLELGN